MEHERDAPLLGTLQDPAPPPPQKLPSRLPFYVLATLVVDLQAYLIGFTVSFSGPTIRSIIADTGLCGSGWAAGDAICSRAELVVACPDLVALGAALLAGRLSGRLGCRRLLLLNCAPWMAGYGLLACARSYTTVLAARLVIGFAQGASSALIQPYVGECAPPSCRGILMGMLNLVLCCGIFTTQLFGLGVSSRAHWWRVMAAFGVAPAAVHLALVGACFPEAPPHLVRQGRLDAAKRALVAIHGGGGGDHDATVRDLHALHAAKPGAAARADPLCARRYLYPACLGVATVGAFSLSGQKIVNSYLNDILAAAGDTDDGDKSVELGALGYGAAQVLISLLGILYFIPKFGRKPLLVGSLVGAALGSGVLGLSYALDDPGLNAWLPIVAVVFYVACISFGVGPLAWAYSTEVSPERIRAQVSGAAVAVFWGFNFLFTNYFKELETALTQQGVFFAFAGFSFVSAGLLALFAVETKGKSLVELERIFLGAVGGLDGAEEDLIA